MFADEKLSWLLILCCVKKYARGFHLKNPKHEARNSKRFDKLITLSLVEGQYQNTNLQMF